jgi:phosphoribosylformimino-5-aminoimidazole carboxamide ribotide isomerase
MLAIPAIDLRGGRVAQLAGAEFDKEKNHVGDPRDIARRWTGYGFQRLHVMDLDAAAGRATSKTIVRDLLEDVAVPLQVGGGVRTSEDVERLLSEGAGRVVVGTRAIDDADWLHEITAAYPGAVVLAADVRDRRIVGQDWPCARPRNVLDVIDDLRGVALGGLIVNIVHHEGQLSSADLMLTEEIADASEWPVMAAAGASSMHELRSLEERGVAGAILGAALYSGALDPRILAEEFSA